jgi:hypothetical protein
MATPDQLLGSGRADPPPLSARGPGALRDTADRAEPRPTAPRLSVACERREGVVVLALDGRSTSTPCGPSASSWSPSGRPPSR